MTKPKEMHMADKLTDFVFRAKKRYDEGTLDSDALKKIDEFIDVLSAKGRFGSVMVGLAKNVPAVDISKIVDYLTEKEPSLLLNLRSHPDFDYSVFEKVVIESQSFEDFHDRLNMFYGMSTDIPQVVSDEIVNRIELNVREAINRFSLNSGLVLYPDHMAAMENLYKRTACFSDRSDIISMLVSAEELMLMATLGSGVQNTFSKSFLKNVATWAWEQADVFKDHSLNSLASKITVIGMNGDHEFANLIAEKYPEASQHARDNIDKDPSTYRYFEKLDMGIETAGFNGLVEEKVAENQVSGDSLVI